MNDTTLTRPGFLARWRERSRERLSHEPPHTEWWALCLSLEAVYEARMEGREFSWACPRQAQIAVLAWCVSRAFRR